MNWIWLLFISFSGFLLLMIELLIIPGFGVTGITGLGLLIVSIVISFFWLPVNKAMLFSSVVAGVSAFSIIASIKILPRIGTRRGLVLQTAQNNKLAYRTSSPELEKLVGKVGGTLTPLRPSGIAIFDGLRVDVVSEGGFLPKNTPVKVTLVQGRKVVVKAIK